MAKVRTTCAYCGVGCGIVAQLNGERDLTIAGDEAHPANNGRLCSKGTYLGETVGLEGRLLHPMIGQERVSWDSALDEVAGRMRDTIARHGPDSVAFYVSGQLLTEDYYVVNKLAKGFVGTANIDTNSRLCMASAVAAHQRAFGEDVVPCSYADLDQADLVLLVGSNTAWCHPVIWQRIEAAREARGTRVVVIDPRRTETAERADLFVQLAPDGDIALFNALLAEMAARDLLDQRFLAERCRAPADFWTGLACDHGIDAATFEALADMVAAHPRMVTLFSQGANQSVCGTDKGNAIINLHLGLGRINQQGAGPFSITGQPNAMGGREVGGLANMLACHLGFADEECDAVAAFWDAPTIARRPGPKAVEMFRAVYDGRIRFLWVMGTNPAVSMPDATFVRAALGRCETLVVSDIIADTDTARFAHIRLPALGWGEKDGTVTNSERRVSRQRAIMPPPGEARADWQITAEVARLLGYGDAFAYERPADVFREYAAMTALAAVRGMALDLSDLADCTDSEYERMEPFQWGGALPFAQRFPTSDGKARLVSVDAPVARLATSEYPLTLNTGRYRDQWHTMTRTGLSAKLSVHRREPLVEVHPSDIQRLGLDDEGFATVRTRSGAAVYRVAASEGQRRGEVFVPMHFSDATAGVGRTGSLVDPLADAVSGQPAFKNVKCTIAPVVPDWRAFLVIREPLTPSCLYWARARIAGGWLFELAGMGMVETTSLLPAGERCEVTDRKRGMLRVTVPHPHDGLAAALYVTRSGRLPEQDWIIRQFAAPDASQLELLAGRPSTPLPDRGPIVCVCMDVGEKEIVSAVLAGECSIANVGAITRAGTNCGSCRPLIARLIETTQLEETQNAA